MTSRLVRRGTQAVALATLLLGLTVGAGAESGDDNVLHACVKEANGQLRLVAPGTRCLPSEVAVDWNYNGGGASVRTSSEPRAFYEVVDAGGTLVGPVVSLMGLYPVIGFKVDGAAFILYLTGGILYGADMVYFESANCSPPGHIAHTFGTLQSSGVGPSGQVYAEDPAAPDVTIFAQSFAYGGVCYPAGGSLTVPRATLATTLGPGPYQVR